MKIWAYVMLAITAIGGFLTFMFTMKKAGRDSARAAVMDKVTENADKARRARSDPDNSRVRKFDRPE